jgi:hypothetical protein
MRPGHHDEQESHIKRLFSLSDGFSGKNTILGKINGLSRVTTYSYINLRDPFIS